MRKFYTLLFLSFLFGNFSIAQTQSKSMTNISVEDDIWFVAVMVDETSFPQENFTIDNADLFIQNVQTWITADQTRYQNLVMSSTTGVVVIKRSDYFNLPQEAQAKMKEWVMGMNRYLSMQDGYQIDNTKRYLLSSSDFSDLMSIIK